MSAEVARQGIFYERKFHAPQVSHQFSLQLQSIFHPILEGPQLDLTCYLPRGVGTLPELRLSNFRTRGLPDEDLMWSPLSP